MKSMNKKTVSEEDLEDIQVKFYDQIEGAVDKIYFIFHTFGWIWFDNILPPDRNEIKETILENIRFSLETNEPVTSGRIMVDASGIEEDKELMISIEL